MRMVRAIPPGGNWKNIPPDIPSKRLDQIRASFARGEGSRSTYYGRLRPDAPSYTINTYFSRPGNGCHIHPTQDRVISQREAARLQSFPDSFRFEGPNGSINTQIGNAVPPLVGYLIARQLGAPGRFVDLFAGAGGLSLGFTWAGWTPVVANDIDRRFLATYARNVHSNVIAGDIRDAAIADAIVEACERDSARSAPFWVLGGPPCQGFSTAGNRRSMDDERNLLFVNYREIVDRLEPDGFIFENVTGLLNMQGGEVFESVRSILADATDDLEHWILAAEKYGVPQRRTRVVVVGVRGRGLPSAPEPITAFPAVETVERARAPAVTVDDAIADLPLLTPGEDGSDRGYVTDPANGFQRLTRGRLSATEFLDGVEEERVRGKRSEEDVLSVG